MEILQIIIIACVGAVLCICVKEFSPSMGAACLICTGLVLTYYVAQNLQSVLTLFKSDLFNQVSTQGWVGLIIKCVFITFAAEIGSILCEDLGYKSFSNKISIISRLSVFGMLIPEIIKIYEYITELI